MAAYYNELDPFAAAWLRELIADGLIAPGDVDERSIEDVRPNELRGYDQCHFFAGIGGWSRALRLASWPDDRPVWTGSCPCQPFSAAGKGAGFSDERHLWPAWFHLITVCRPDVVFGEQVEAAVRHGWLDLVSADLEGEGYAIGAAVLGAHSVGAPHIRQRLWWVADRDGGACEQGNSIAGRRDQRSDAKQGPGLSRCGKSDSVADRSGTGLEGRAGTACAYQFAARAHSVASQLGISNRDGREPGSETAETARHGNPVEPAGFWDAVEWIHCRDGKWRPTQSGIQRVVDGLSADLGYVRLESYPDRPHEERLILAPLIHKGKTRVGRLRGYGNAIVPQVAAEFIEACYASIL